MLRRVISGVMRLLQTRSSVNRAIAGVILAAAVVVLYAQHTRLASGYAEPGQILHGRIVSVIDGDTAVLLTADHEQVRIRLAFIDAPEKQQPYGQAAKQHLAKLIYNKMVDVSVQAQDRYGRTLGQMTCDGVEVNLAQIAAGYAWHYVFYADKAQSRQAFAQYAQAQLTATQGKVGLWQHAEPTPPWAFRRLRKGK